MVDIKLGKMYKIGIMVKMCCCYSGVKRNGSKLHIVAVRFFALMWKTMALFSICRKFARECIPFSSSLPIPVAGTSVRNVARPSRSKSS